MRPPLPRAVRCAIVALTCLAAARLPACNTGKQYSQTELTTLQSREFDAGYEQTYAAAVNALFDAGYVIRSSDKDAGFISASRTVMNSWGTPAGNLAQLKIDAAGRRTSVRVSTGDGSQQHVNKKQIDELLNLIDRRLVGDLTVPAAKPAPAASGSVQGPGR